MADDPTTEPPEGFWDDFQKWALEQFAAGKSPTNPTAPAPDPKTAPPTDPTPAPKKRKTWFNNE